MRSDTRAQGYNHRFGRLGPKSSASCQLASSNTLGSQEQLLVGRRDLPTCTVHRWSCIALHTASPGRRPRRRRALLRCKGSERPARCPARARAPGPATPSTRALGRRRRAPATAKRNNGPRAPRFTSRDGRAFGLLGPRGQRPRRARAHRRSRTSCVRHREWVVGTATRVALRGASRHVPSRSAVLTRTRRRRLRARAASDH